MAASVLFTLKLDLLRECWLRHDQASQRSLQQEGTFYHGGMFPLRTLMLNWKQGALVTIFCCVLYLELIEVC